MFHFYTPPPLETSKTPEVFKHFRERKRGGGGGGGYKKETLAQIWLNSLYDFDFNNLKFLKVIKSSSKNTRKEIFNKNNLLMTQFC